MKIAVCVKQIPDPNTPYALDPETHFVQRPQDQILDDTDRYGVEVGLQLAEATGGTVTLVSMCPAGSLQGIRQALAMGAAKAVIVNDPALRGSGALVTAKVLAAVLRKEQPDLIIAGTESTDGYTGVVPQQLAELLGLPCLTFARKVTQADGKIRIERMTAGGYDVVEAPLAGADLGHLRGGRAPLPHLQGDHGGQVQADRAAHRRRPRASARTTSGRPVPPRRSSECGPPPSGAPAARSSMRVKPIWRSCRLLEQVKVI